MRLRSRIYLTESVKDLRTLRVEAFLQGGFVLLPPGFKSSADPETLLLTSIPGLTTEFRVLEADGASGQDAAPPAGMMLYLFSRPHGFYVEFTSLAL